MGEGLVEAARGTIGHRLRIEQSRIARVHIVAPTDWNFSLRDNTGGPRPPEAALVGTAVGPVKETPLAVQHIPRSLDP